MLYDTSNPLDKESFLERAKLLASRGDVVEMRSKRARTSKQNAYLHVILAYFGSQYGEGGDYIKEEYFKRLVNPDIFITDEVTDQFTGKQRIHCRSTADLTVEEMTQCIDRFRNWAAKEAGIYIPSPEDYDMIKRCEVEISKVQKYV